MERQVKSRVGAVVGAVGELVKDVERVSRGETAALTTSSAKLSAQKQKDSTLASTGQVWSTCDALMSLGATSPADILVKKAEEYRALLRDAIDELKEWAEDEDEGFDDGEVSDQDSDVQFGPSKCPRDKPEIKAQIDIAVKKLRLVDMGYKAVEKRRLKTFPFEDVGQDDIGNRDKVELRVKRLDKVMSLLGKVPEEVDELAGKFYELDETGADAQLQRCCDAAITAIEAVKHGWDERPADPEGPRPYRPEDKTFPDWVDKWMLLLQQG